MLHELLIKKLHEKFGENITTSIEENSRLMEEAEVKAKAICYLGGILEKSNHISSTQKSVLTIYNEVFSDLTVALYLCACAIDNSSQILLRRALELGIATVYLWDLPNKYWSWSQWDDYNNDLNFNEMIDHINSKGYLYFVNHENNSVLSELIHKDKVNKLYRALSNVIHGKMATFESLTENRFAYQSEDFEKLIHSIICVENVLLTLWKKRHPIHFLELERLFLTLTKYRYEY